MAAFTGLKNNQRKWVIEWAQSGNDPESLGIDKCNLFIGGLNPSLVTKELLEERFLRYGNIESVTLVNKEADLEGQDSSFPPGRSAFAFVRYADPASSASAIEFENGAEWLERKIRVQYCESQEMKNKRRATKYYNAMSPYSNQYYRGAMGPMFPYVSGVPVYGVPPTHRNVYSRKGDMQEYNPYMGYPLMNTGMVYGNQPWLYTQMQQQSQLQTNQSTGHQHQQYQSGAASSNVDQQKPDSEEEELSEGFSGMTFQRNNDHTNIDSTPRW